jgi:hypothetical protein
MSAYVRMPFGKHRGEALADVPTSYLDWLTTINLELWLRRAVEAELRRRDWCEGPRADGGPAPPVLSWERIVKRWFAKPSMRYHPDRGGSQEAMEAVNTAREELVKAIEEERQLCPA